MDSATALLEKDVLATRKPAVAAAGVVRRQVPIQAPDTAYLMGTKRIIDITVSLLAIFLLLSWMIPILFVLIRFSSRGGLFFIQDRVGVNGRVFRCIKFRTMRLNEGKDSIQANYEDHRVTSIGRFLRKTHIDELPQLFNVLKNEMSLVGPRPHMLYHDALFANFIPAYPLRHLVKPGITGLAQSRGFHGATPDFLSISNRTRLDLFYTSKVSLGLDLKILLRTLFLLPLNAFQHGKHSRSRS